MTPTEINKKCHEKLGLHQHKFSVSPGGESVFCVTCGATHGSNTDFFNDPVALLMELEKWEHGKLFFAKLIYAGDNVEAVDDDGYISREYMTTPGLLATKLCEWEG